MSTQNAYRGLIIVSNEKEEEFQKNLEPIANKFLMDDSVKLSPQNRNSI